MTTEFALSDAQLLRYSRHILLDEIGVEAQARLCAGSVLIVGAGGLGSPAAMYLASAGVGRIILADADTVDLTNLQRQIVHRESTVGMAKVASARQTLAQLNPSVEVVPLEARLAGEQLAHWVAQVDLVLDCCDNFETRHAVNRACVAAKKPLVSGAAVRFDGQLSVFDPRGNNNPCYHCLFPEGEDLEETRCATMGVFAPITGLIGTLQAAEALKLLGQFGQPLIGKLLLVDARNMSFSQIKVPKDASCPVCAHPQL